MLSHINGESCPHDNFPECNPVKTEKSVIGDLEILVTGSEIELTLQRSPGKTVFEFKGTFYQLNPGFLNWRQKQEPLDAFKTK